MYFYKKYQNLTVSEKIFIGAHPVATAVFNINAEIAYDEAKKRFSTGSLINGAGDAFRHCFWSAMNARDQGKKLAKEFGDAHEDFADNPIDQKKHGFIQ